MTHYPTYLNGSTAILLTRSPPSDKVWSTARCKLSLQRTPLQPQNRWLLSSPLHRKRCWRQSDAWPSSPVPSTHCQRGCWSSTSEPSCQLSPRLSTCRWPPERFLFNSKRLWSHLYSKSLPLMSKYWRIIDRSPTCPTSPKSRRRWWRLVYCSTSRKMGCRSGCSQRTVPTTVLRLRSSESPTTCCAPSTSARPSSSFSSIWVQRLTPWTTTFSCNVSNAATE